MSRQTSAIRKKQAALRTAIWPELNEAWLWDRAERKGFTTIPRCLPLICSIIDDLTQGQPASSTYMELWCRAFDDQFVTLSKSKELAFHSGFAGQRAERTWKQRMKALADLGFIDIRPGSSGPYTYALILNPYLVVKKLHEARTIGLTADKYNALLDRCVEIGEDSLDEPVPGPLQASPVAHEPEDDDDED